MEGNYLHLDYVSTAWSIAFIASLLPVGTNLFL